MKLRTALQTLLALASFGCASPLFADPNITQRIPGAAEELSGVAADPAPLFAAPTRLDRIGRVMTHVMVNGKGPYRFVIDTGASRSTLAPHLARDLGLKPSVGRNIMLNGVTGAAEVTTVEVQTLEIGALRFEQQNLPVIFTSIMGNADGILGVAGFQDQRIDVDFRRDRVSVIASTGRPVRFDMIKARAHRNEDGLMIVDARVGNVRCKAIIDTGAERTLGNAALQTAVNRYRRKSREPVAATVHGATDAVADGEVQSVRKLAIGEMSFNNLEVIFGDFHVFKLWELDGEPAILVGMDVLGVLERLVIDYRRNEVSMYGDRAPTTLRLADR